MKPTKTQPTPPLAFFPSRAQGTCNTDCLTCSVVLAEILSMEMDVQKEAEYSDGEDKAIFAEIAWRTLREHGERDRQGPGKVWAR